NYIDQFVFGKDAAANLHLRHVWKTGVSWLVGHCGQHPGVPLFWGNTGQRWTLHQTPSRYERRIHQICCLIPGRLNYLLSFTASIAVHDGRQFMKYIDPKLGVPLPERDYGGNCLIYDPGNVTDPFHNLWVRKSGNFLFQC
ncbi:hypothetical protein XENOCAPTIV_006003, partial [Xenoophorus captivus]